MPLGSYSGAAWTGNGGLQVADSVEIEVREEDGTEAGGALIDIFSDPDGNNPITNPSAFADDFGRFLFFAEGQTANILFTQGTQEFRLRHQQIGNAQSRDASSDATPGDVVLRDVNGGAKLTYTIMPGGDEPTNESDEASFFAISHNGEMQAKYRDGQGRTFDLARDSVFIVRNNTGAAMSAGDAVYVASQTGNVPDVALAKADSASTMPAVGVLAQDLSDGAFGKAVRVGLVDFDTSAFAVGDRLFVSDGTAGALTATRPSLPNRAQFIGTVLVSGDGNGQILADVTSELLSADDASEAPSADSVPKRTADSRVRSASGGSGDEALVADDRDTPGSLLTTGNLANGSGSGVAQVDVAEEISGVYTITADTTDVFKFERPTLNRWRVRIPSDSRFIIDNADTTDPLDSRIQLGGSSDPGVAVGGVNFMGAKTFNAPEIYENGNRVQTDYVFDAYLDGQIDYDHYDALMGTRWVESETETEPVEEEEEVTEECEDYKEEWDEKQQAYVRRKCTKRKPVYDEYPVKDEDGNQIGVRRVKRTRTVTKYVPKQVEVQDEHKPAKRFDFDDLDPDSFWQKCQQFRKLPAFKRCEDNLREGQERPSMGQISQALTETVEDMAVHIHELHERLKKLEG